MLVSLSVWFRISLACSSRRASPSADLRSKTSMPTNSSSKARMTPTSNNPLWLRRRRIFLPLSAENTQTPPDLIRQGDDRLGCLSGKLRAVVDYRQWCRQMNRHMERYRHRAVRHILHRMIEGYIRDIRRGGK